MPDENTTTTIKQHEFLDLNGVGVLKEEIDKVIDTSEQKAKEHANTVANTAEQNSQKYTNEKLVEMLTWSKF